VQIWPSRRRLRFQIFPPAFLAQAVAPEREEAGEARGKFSTVVFPASWLTSHARGAFHLIMPVSLLALGFFFAVAPAAHCSPKPDDDVRRQAAITDFTQKMKEANYPALFDQAAQEFNVPSDLLKAVAFAETRWEHLTWPPGETVSPETGMPRPYGIMSLWDNDYFGHSLIDAAKLIGKTPEDLKQDPLQNIRGGAALLRKLYDETPRPDGSTEAQIESWRFAVRKYTGIPEPDLSAQHALKVYTFMNEGYHDYGIDWQGRPVNLKPLQLETKAIMEVEQRNKSGRNPNAVATSPAAMPDQASNASTKVSTAVTVTNPPSEPKIPMAQAGRKKRLWWMLAAMALVLFCRLVLLRKPKP
jgi:hypothetical protein